MKAFLSLITDLKKITFSPLLCYKRKKNKKILGCFFSLFVFFVLVSPDLAFTEKLTQSEITVKGRIILQSGDLIPEEGLNVVLLKLVLNAEGEITPLGPQGRVKTDNKGHFKFLRINSDYRAGYQLGTRVDGKLYSSFILPSTFDNDNSSQLNENNIYLGNLLKQEQSLANTTNIGFQGFITRVRYEPNAINTQEALNIYKAGINKSLLSSVFNKYGLKVSFLEYNKEKGSFSI